jgi:hypothetical protein
MKNEDAVRSLIVKEIKKILREDYARGIPDFALEEAAVDAVEGLRRSIKAHIQQVVTDSSKQRQMLTAANVIMKEAQAEIKAVLEEKLSDFFRSV